MGGGKQGNLMVVSQWRSGVTLRIVRLNVGEQRWRWVVECCEELEVSVPPFAESVEHGGAGHLV